jgi:hypothetical protein
VTRRPAKSISISFQHHFNCTGGRTSNVLQKVKWLKLRLLVLRATLVGFLFGGILPGIAFLPGEVEGNYRGGFVSSCGCDSVTFINLREGKMLTYIIQPIHPRG